MFFTQEDYLKIEKWLKARAVKDSQFPELTDYDQPNPDDYFVILQGNKTNAKVKVTKAFLHIYNGLQNRPILKGSGNYSLITDSKWTTRPNEASGEGSIAIGLGNNKASKYLSIAIGQNNIVDSQFSWGLGSDNNIQSVDGYNKVFGNNNIINRGSRNYIIGDNNNLQYSSYNYVFGLNNYISDSNSSSVIIGSDNNGSDGGSSIYIGKGLEGTANNGIASINLGQYNINVPGNNYLFTIGNGKNGNRSNIFSIGYNGDINIQNIGSKTLQAYLKDLETSKQNKLIAGAGIEISSNNTISCTLDPVIFVVVDTLPLVPEDANINKIHLVKDTTVSGNLYSEYLYVNNTWEKLGDFQPSIDLSNYVDKTSNQTIGGTKTFDKLVKVKNLTIISQQDNMEGSNISLELQDDREIDPFLANVLSLGDGRYGTPCRVVIPLWENELKSLVPIYPSEVITNSYLYYNYAKLDRENVFTENIVIKSNDNKGLYFMNAAGNILSYLNREGLQFGISQYLGFKEGEFGKSFLMRIDNDKFLFECGGLPASLSGIATPTANNDAANKEYVDTQVKAVDDKVVALELKTNSLDSRTPVDSGISFLRPWEFFPEYSEDVQVVQNYILPGFLQINNQMTSVDGLFNHIRDNNLAGKSAYFTIYGSLANPSVAIIGNIDTGAVGYKISFSTISRYSDDTSFNNRLIFFEIEIGNPFGDGIVIMHSRLMNICIKDTLSQIDNNTSKIQTLETKNTELTNTITALESRIAELENIISQITIKEE